MFVLIVSIGIIQHRAKRVSARHADMRDGAPVSDKSSAFVRLLLGI